MPFTLVHGDAQPGNVIVEEGQLPLVIDWEFTRIGDPREDLAYYAQIPMPPNIYQMDPAGYLAQYRELTGFSEELVNTDTVDWFRTMAMSALIIQVAQGTDSFAQGGPGGVLVTYLTNAITFNSNEGYRSIARWAGRKGVRP
jgi:aminoglycoside phosphotransferase (APT) family kinase protein